MGPGTRWLAGLERGDRLEVTGPLGRPFALPKEPVPTVLVGEGYAAAAPLFTLAERLRERDCPVTLVLGAVDEGHLLNALEARRTARAVTVVTRDGSVGARGGVVDVIDDVLRRAGADVVYAAGPVATLHAVARAAEAHGAWSQTALEQPLTCATGLCQGCPVPVVGEDGVARTAAPAPTGRCCAATGCAGTTSSPPGARRDAARRAAPGLPGAGRSPAAAARRELAAYGPLEALGAFTTRTVTLDARAGGALPRLVETPSGLLHATGLPNPGVDGFLATELPWLLQQRARVVVSVAARSLAELAELARRLGTAPGVSAVEVNLSPPDTGPEGDLMTAREPFQVGAAVAAVERDCPAACRCWPSCAPTRCAWSRRPGPRSTPAPRRWWSARRCRARCPTVVTPGSAGPRSVRWRCAASPRCWPRSTCPSWPVAASPPSPTCGPASPPGPSPCRSAPRCCTTPPPPRGWSPR